MILIKEKLAKHGYKSSDFIHHLCDERKDLGLEKYAGEDMIEIDTNGGGGSLISIDERLIPVLEKFLNEK